MWTLPETGTVSLTAGTLAAPLVSNWSVGDSPHFWCCPTTALLQSVSWSPRLHWCLRVKTCEISWLETSSPGSGYLAPSRVSECVCSCIRISVYGGSGLLCLTSVQPVAGFHSKGSLHIRESSSGCGTKRSKPSEGMHAGLKSPVLP